MLLTSSGTERTATLKPKCFSASGIETTLSCGSKMTCSLAKDLLRRPLERLADQSNLIRSERIPAIFDVEQQFVMQGFRNRALPRREAAKRRQAIERLDIALDNRDTQGLEAIAE